MLDKGLSANIEGLSHSHKVYKDDATDPEYKYTSGCSVNLQGAWSSTLGPLVLERHREYNVWHRGTTFNPTLLQG